MAESEPVKLMVSGALWLGSRPLQTVEIRRGMRILSQDGSVVGEVAAVVRGGPTNDITHLILVRLCPTLEYRLLPITLVADVRGEEVISSLDSHGITTLPLWESSQTNLHY